LYLLSKDSAMTALTLALSIGDPSGIGPEVILRALLSEARPEARCLVFGPRSLFESLAASLGLPLPETEVEFVDDAAGRELARTVVPGQPSEAAGRLQVHSLEAALAAVLSGAAGALCTAPITKASARAAGFPFPGHTEFLASRCSVSRFVMMLAGPSLRVVPATMHIPLAEVPSRLTRRVVADALEVTALGLVRDLGVPRPRVALAALNPHAGEGGMLGVEEERTLRPALEEAAAALERAGVPARLVGPLSADGLFAHHREYDAVVCAYHDQAMIPLKLLHRDEGVNITLGLPIVRTSPAHGSAHDIAGRGVAREGSLLAALRLALEVAERRRAARG
jgi:4-hydroxythreonine-4-phosphate dehydrogenase